MEKNLNTFERLVLTMKSSERQDLLRRIAEVSEAESDRQPSRPLVSEPVSALIQGLSSEPFIVRLWFTVRAFFSSTTPAHLYTESLVARLGKDLHRNFPLFIDTKQSVLQKDFYEQLLLLKQTASFFSGLLASCEDDKGGFYVFLGSMIMTSTDERIIAETDPLTAGRTDESSTDQRLSLLRKLDSILSLIPEDERSRMYQAAQSIEWIKAFCSISFDRMLLRFNTYGQRTVCPLDSVSDELRFLARVLSSARRIPVILLEAMHLFTVQERVQDPRFDLETECTAFVTKAGAYLANIKSFRNVIPINDIVRFTLRDVAWKPNPVEGGEDWFVVFKNAWKKRFDQKWGLWQRHHRRAQVIKSILYYLGSEELPKLEYHPWENLWVPLTFNREMSLGFIKAFFSSVYPELILRQLKVVLIEGEFYRRENLNEYTDTYNTLEHMQHEISLFETRLSPKGDIGEGFELVKREKMATTKGKARLDNLMMSLESTADDIVSRLTAAFRTMDLLLGGILGIARGGQYETLVNMASLQGKANDKFRQQLAKARELMNTAGALLGDAEVVEKEGL